MANRLSRNSALYVSSRTIFVLSQQYLPLKYANVFGRTNRGNTPLASILICSALGFLSLIGLSQYAFSQVRWTILTACPKLMLFTASHYALRVLHWHVSMRLLMSMCHVSKVQSWVRHCRYVWFDIALADELCSLDRIANDKTWTRNGEIHVLSRNDDLYVERLFKSRWQPLPAWIGIIGCSFVIVWSGIPPLLILCAKGSLTSTEGLKSTTALAFDVVGAYAGVSRVGSHL
jgi:amino acid transporter